MLKNALVRLSKEHQAKVEGINFLEFQIDLKLYTIVILQLDAKNAGMTSLLLLVTA